MQKMFHRIFLFLCIVSFGSFCYEIVNLCNIPRLAYSAFLTMIAGIICIFLEERPRKTEEQRKFDDKIQNQAFLSLILVTLIAIICIFKTI